jgi:hypothetical protein
LHLNPAAKQTGWLFRFQAMKFQPGGKSSKALGVADGGWTLLWMPFIGRPYQRRAKETQQIAAALMAPTANQE